MVKIFHPQNNLLVLIKGKLSQTSLIVIGDTVTYGINFLSIIALARLLPIDTMGTYRQFIYLGAFFVNLFECGITNSIYRFWNTLENKEKSAYSKMVFAFLLVSGIIAALALVVLAKYVSLLYQNPDLDKFIKIVAIYPLASMVVMMVRPILISDGYSILVTGIETFFAILSFFALSIPVFWGYSFDTSLRIWIIVLLIRLVLVPILIRKELFQNAKFIDKSLIRKLASYIWPIQAARITGIIMSYFDKFYLSIFLTPGQFAIYSLGAREIPFIGSVGTSVSNVLIPKLVRDNIENNIDSLLLRWKSACRRTALYTYLPIAFCVMFTDQIIEFLYTDIYSASAEIFRIFACITFFRVIEYASLAKIIEQTRLILKVALIGIVTIFILAYPMTKIFGSVGMAYTVFVSSFISVCYFLAWYRKFFKVSLQKFFPLNQLLRYLYYSFISTGLIRIALNDWSHSINSNPFISFLHIFLLFTMCAIIYGFLVFLDQRIFPLRTNCAA